MPVEVATSIATLNPAWPLGTDEKEEGDNHIRLIKSVLQSDAKTSAYLGKSGGYTAVKADSGNTLVFSAAATLALTAAATLGTGWYVRVIAPLNGDVVIDPNAAETIDGVATVTVRRGTSCLVFCNGTLFVTDRQQNTLWEKAGEPVQISAGQASVIFNNLDAFRRIKVSGLIRPTAVATIIGHVSNDNGATWLSGASDYFAQVVNGAAAVAGAGQVTGSSLFISNGTAGSAVNQGMRLDLELDEFNKAAMSFGENIAYSLGATIVIAVAGVTVALQQAHNAIRLSPNTSTLAAGWVTIEGIRG